MELKDLILAQKEEYEIILDSVPAWIFYKDDKNNFLDVNKTFADAMQKTKEELEGKSLFDLYTKEEASVFLKDDLEVIASKTAKRNIIESIESPVGDRIWVQTDKIPYRNEAGDVIGVIGFSIDITAKKIAEDELKKALEFSERTNMIMVERELKMMELKKRIEELEGKNLNGDE